MQTVDQLLNRVKSRHDIGSDYKLALFLGLKPNALNNYRHGKSLPDINACTKIAEALGIDPDLLIVQIEAQRAKTGEARAIWERMAARLQGGAVHSALLACLVALGFITTTPSAHAVVTDVSTSSGSVYYVKLAMALFQRSISRRLGKLRSFVQGITDVQSARPIAPPLAFA